jgi:hypothetical protein
MGIVAAGAIFDDTRRGPTTEPFAMSATLPVRDLFGMALPADLVAMIEDNRLALERVQLIGSSAQLMAGLARHHPGWGVLQGDFPMGGFLPLGLGRGPDLLHGPIMTTGTGKAGNLGGAGGDVEVTIGGASSQKAGQIPFGAQAAIGIRLVGMASQIEDRFALGCRAMRI